MIKFNREEFLEVGRKVYSQRSAVEELADNLTKRGYDNIVIIGIGGTWAEWHPVVQIMRHYSDIPVFLENAAEIVIKRDKNYLTTKSIVITASDSGNTKEILEAVDMCKSLGIEVAGFSKDEKTPLAERLDYFVSNPGKESAHAYQLFFIFALRLLFNRGEYPLYEKFADQMETLFENLARIREEFEPKAAEIARMYAKEPYNMFIGSGALWGETYLFTMCILEEMQWVRTKAVSSADFFHGTIELVDKDVPVFLFKGEDEYRVLDERVERFIKKYNVTDKFVLIDTKDYYLKGIGDEFRVICSPIILNSLVTNRLARHYEHNTGHSLDFRRYYRQLDY
jgi:fructoselysine-6-phosphate deglycase